MKRRGDHIMVLAAGRRPFTTEVRIRLYASPFGKLGGERKTFCLRRSVSSCHYHYASSPFSFIRPSATLHYLSNWL